MIETQKLSFDQIYQLMRKEILRLEEECRMRKYRDKPDEYTDYAVEDRIERRRLHKEYDDSILREEQKKRELADRLIEWAQNNEMVDNKYTDHGKDCLEAAKLLREFKKSNRSYEWTGLE